MTRKISVPDYPAFLAELKQRIRNARTAAVFAINRELVLLYWHIGRGIVEKQKTLGWGDAVVERLATDLRIAFPDMRGFSLANLWRMKQFYVLYTSPDFLAQAVREFKSNSPKINFPPRLVSTRKPILAQAVRELVSSVPWGHQVLMLGRIKNPAASLYYLRSTARFGWSRDVLLNQIKACAYERAVKEKKTHNFELALPEHLAEQADEMLKSSYNLEFLGVGRVVKERELEDRLLDRVRDFILELGYGFCFVGRQYRLVLGHKEYFVDLLFYHRFLRALVALDLKIGSFLPEHAGKMDFYLNVLNDLERGRGDAPSIGIILCAEKYDVEVEYALKTKSNPIGVADYRLQASLPEDLKGKLPTEKQLAALMREILPAKTISGHRARLVSTIKKIR